MYRIRLFEMYLMGIALSHREASARVRQLGLCVREKCGHLRGMRLQGGLPGHGPVGEHGSLAVINHNTGNCRLNQSVTLESSPGSTRYRMAVDQVVFHKSLSPTQASVAPSVD